ncbi:metallophosphoesterase family protein [Actinoplanes sp. NPDC049668]|uniref:metallophosphoesterase family protein n=1 Tax=unclassified Actinoplanes TaxID=2626549 RepID=UPI0033ADC788
MRILHLSDTHLGRAGARESLSRLLHDCRELAGLSAVVVTGDVADDGTTEAYTAALELVGGFARRHRIPAIFTTGNHDERAAFTAVLGTGHLDAEGRDRPDSRLDAPGGERAAVTVVDGYRVVTLDSLVPGSGYGLIGAAQLAWLRDVLAEPAPNGTVLAFHHPPVVVPGEPLQEALGLRDGPDLAGAVGGTDVRLILCGHFHLQLYGMLASVPVWVTPGVVDRIDLTATPGTLRGVRGASASLIDLGGPHSRCTPGTRTPARRPTRPTRPP